MFPAARKGDPITHDLLVPSGVIGPPVTGPCPQGVVLIEGLPAAHVNCTAICTGAITAGVVHPPIVPPAPYPPIVMGSTSVLIHGMPAARWSPSTDVSACGAFLGNPLLAPTRTVLIGDVAMGGGAGAPPAEPPSRPLCEVCEDAPATQTEPSTPQSSGPPGQSSAKPSSEVSPDVCETPTEPSAPQ
jgi:uncharacterized Zn-binding protein involved in type VI secretion